MPRGFELLANDWVTALGFCGRLRARAFVAVLLGPPSELEPMFRLRLQPVLSLHFPWLASQAELAGTSLLIPESSLEESMQRHRQAAVSWSTRGSEDRIAFSLCGGSESERERFFAGLSGELGPVRIQRGEIRPVELLFRLLEERGLSLTLAYSCTSGLVAKMLTDLPGSSRVFWGGAVSYSNSAKQRLLRVEDAILGRHGAVSRQTAVAMADGLLAATPADLAFPVTSIAGPGGGTPDKPVGTVWVRARRWGGSE